uniref:Uncharacterized protein n=1 Tax=Ditylenchus dipsaci TaxID=166011 RepID=A0A915DZ45_9BILA
MVAMANPNFIPYSCEKSDNGMTKIYLMLEESSPLYGTPVYLVDHNNEINKKLDIRPGQIIDIVPGFISYPDYIIAYGNCKENANSTSPVTCDQEMKFHAQWVSAAYVLNLVDDGRKTTADPQILDGTLTELVRPNSISMLWQLPQFFFSYSQAAPTMKSVLQAFWLLTTFFGNVIDMEFGLLARSFTYFETISGTHLIKEPATEFFFYALLMAIVIGVFVAIALNYTYVDEHAMEASLSISSSEEDRQRKTQQLMATQTKCTEDLLKKRH